MESDYGVINATVYDDWVNFLENEGEFTFSQKLPITTTTINDDNNNNNNNNYDISPIMNSSITTTPSLTAFDAPNDFFDSPLAGSTSSVSFNTSPNLEPTLRFFPDLDITIANTPSVIIPLDDEVITTTVANNLSSVVNPELPSSPALNIPWVSDTADGAAEDFVPDFNNNNNNDSSSTIPSPSPIPSSSSLSSSPSSSPSNNNNNKGNRKRSSEEIEKDPEQIAAIKRAKNTDAARRSRLRKAMKMESLEKQVSDLKTDNNELQTKIAVMESEKKALEEKNSDKDLRIRMLEQQLAEVHERLIGRS